MPRYAKDPTAFIILNPHAAKGRAASFKDQIASYFAKEQYECVFALTEKPLHAISLAEQAVLDGYKLIVAAGGDGTVNEVVDGVMRQVTAQRMLFDDRPIIGLIPIGRGNDFAYIAKTPRNIEDACTLVMEQDWMPTDCAFVKGGKFPQGRYFVNGVGLGFEPTVNFVASDFKRLSGMPSYIVAFLKVLMKYPKPVQLTLTIDDKEVQLDTQQISICNGRRMGSAFIMAPNAIIDDGLLDICYANREIKGYEILWYALKFFKGSQVRSPRFTTVRASHCSVSSVSNLPCHADGEEISRGCSSVEVQILPAALKFIRKPL